MGDWLMENGDRSFHSGDFAYDTDNDAWCEMGSSPGSTPVWWRKYGDRGDSFSFNRSRRLTPEEREEMTSLRNQLNKEQKVLNRYTKELEECSSEKHIKQVKDNSTSSTLIYTVVFTPLVLIFLGVVFGVSSLNATVYIAVIVVIVAIFACSFAVLSLSGTNQANREISEAKRKVSDQERVVAEINKKLEPYYGVPR